MKKSKLYDNPNLGNCRHCGYHPVSRNATACPNCGGQTPNPANGCSCLIILILLFVLGSVSMASIQWIQNEASTPTEVEEVIDSEDLDALPAGEDLFEEPPSD